MVGSSGGGLATGLRSFGRSGSKDGGPIPIPYCPPERLCIGSGEGVRSLLFEYPLSLFKPADGGRERH